MSPDNLANLNRLTKIQRPRKRKHTVIVGVVGAAKVHVGIGTLPSGEVIELFLDVHREGSFSRHALHLIANLASLGIQHGVPIRKIVGALRAVDEGPHEVAENDTIKGCRGVLDFVGQVLDQEANAPKIVGAK